ncbi:MAG: dihydrodipicolinate synthetase [Candidatus Aramenus sulfurataquae]|uniref:Dihydrodipicolinate synthetase n=1 Tax=Candidatus Aramenus sulfurataquae TaxID=1326980 RepID=W7KK31_9CREN|nr:MAG: dihydrodipicolinate synthetase [Candidatus Aramenus sulfurataquae]
MEVIVPIVTPFTRDNALDKAKLKEHAENLIEKGIDAIFLNGTTGMGPSLSAEEKKEALKTVYDVTDKVIFQLGGLNLDDVLSLLSFSKDFSILGVASYSPYYYPGLPSKWVVKYFKAIVEKSPHPVYVYNYPQATNFDVTPQLIEEIGGVTGIKDTNDDFVHSLRYKRFTNLKVYNGSDYLTLQSLTFLDGTVTAGGNYMPELLVLQKRLVSQGKVAEALQVQETYYKFLDLARKYGMMASHYVLVKELQGYDVGYPRPPIFPLTQEEVEGITREVRELRKEYLYLLDKYGFTS